VAPDAGTIVFVEQTWISSDDMPTASWRLQRPILDDGDPAQVLNDPEVRR